MNAELNPWAARSSTWRRLLMVGLCIMAMPGASILAAGDEREYFPITPQTPPSVRPQPTRPFEVRPGDVRMPPSQLKPKTFDKNKVKSLFDKANAQPGPKKKSSTAPVTTQSAEGKSKPSSDQPPANRRQPADEPAKESIREKPEDDNESEELRILTEEKAGLPTLKAEDLMRVPEKLEIRTLDPRIYQELPERPGVELPKGGAELPGTGLPGRDGIGGLTGGFQGGLERPVLDENTGEEHYDQGAMPGGYNPATDPSGALGDAGGYLGTAGQAYGGKTGRTMEQIGGVMQSGSLGQAAGRGADILLPGSGGFVEAAANGNTQGMVNAGATAAGSFASDLAIGIIVGLVGGGLLGMAIGYALSATGAGRAIADGVTAGVKWIAEKVGIGGGDPAPAPEPEPTPPPDSGSYDERHSKNNGKKGPSVINENQIRPIQAQLNEDLLGEKRDAEAYVDTSDAPPPRKVAVGAGCDLDGAVATANGSINLKDPLSIKDMERPGYDKY